MSEKRLSGVLSEFARTMLTDYPIQRILDELVLRIVDLLPISGAGVTLISPGHEPRYVAASDRSALRFEQLQTELQEGPCLAAVRTGEPVSVPDLHQDARFRRFGPRAVAEGLAAVYTFPLRQPDPHLSPLGALDLYCDVPRELDAETMAVAQTLADVAAAYLLNAQARAELESASARSRELSLHDPLTGLPNRPLLMERLNFAIRRGHRTGKLVAILFADLDRFKEVNDTYGHATGDQLLVEVAGRISAMLRPGDTLARMSGDEFVILCDDLDHTSDATAIAERVGAALVEPFVILGRSVTATASVGIAFAGLSDNIPDQLLNDADTAMYQAKRKGGGHHQIIDLREQHLAEDLQTLHRDLLGALGRGELHTAYQPIVETADGRITGIEALLRWSHPARGMVPPVVAVPLAEQSGMIGEIGRWVFSNACVDRALIGAAQRRGDLELSVNVSVLQLMTGGFAETVASVLAETGTEPGLVTLEVTESLFIDDPERALIVLNDLKDLGVKLALDDFGTGYASLRYLNRFPFDAIKIDREFVGDLAAGSTGHAIVAAIVAMARTIGMTVVAEGVENAEQHRLVRALGCEASQGFYFAHPMSVDNLNVLVRRPVRDDGQLRLPVIAES